MMKAKVFGRAFVWGIVAVCSAATITQSNNVPQTISIDYGHTRYSSLSQINPGNVQKLQPVWVYDTGAKGRGWEGNPIVADGVMYLSIPGGASALDPETGKEIWKFVPTGLSRPGRDRGVAYWPGDGTLAPRIIYTTVDRLYALDAKSGLPILTFGKEGMVNLRDEVADKYPDAQYTISSPAAIYKNLAIISPSTQEFGSKGPSGDPRAFDVRTGKQVWRFHTVPQHGERFDGSWGPDGWKERAGPSAWGGATVDLATGLVFIPIGNPDDSYNGIDRPGNNYYANSIIALDASTGKLQWFYQMTHHDITDLDAASAPSLIDIHRGGQTIPALVEVPKSGIAFILDRRTGKPVFGAKERPIPQSDVPGEYSSPTQPFPLKPEPLVKMGVSRDDITTLSSESREYCTALWDKQQMHNEGPYTPVSLKGTTVFAPGTSGGGNWGGVSTDPRLGYFFVNVSNMPTTSRMVSDGVGGYKLQGAYARFSDAKGWPCINPPWGEMIAVNANTGDIAWRSPLGLSDDFGEKGKVTGTPNLGGSAATAGGLVFIGATVDSRFRAFDSHTGKEVWTATLPAPAVATPMSFRGKSGRQYVVIPDGGPATIGMPGRFFSYHAILIAYALPKPGEAAIDLASYAAIPTTPRPANGPNQQATAVATPPEMQGEPMLPPGAGREDVLSMCGQCHGVSTAIAVRRSPDGWRDLIQDMRSRGAQGDDTKAGRVRDYLSRYFGLLPAPAEPATGGQAR
jgi:quinoprotein glucose dehydrogenase